MKPILKYLQDLFAGQRILGHDPELEGLAKAEALLLDLVHGQKVPGLAITVIKEGSTILKKGYGYADLDTRRSVDPEHTLFRTASVSKPIAATALAHMVAEGTIDLDASFYDYVPYYPRKEYNFSIRQLAGHTAGIRGYQGIEYGLNEPYSIKEGIAIFKEDPLLFEPGTDYFYNSFDWVLISLAMQEAGGVPFEKYVREKVLHPLGMDSTYAPELHLERTLSAGNVDGGRASVGFGQRERTATFYSKNQLGFRKAIPVNNFYKLAGGGYLSTSADIAKLGQAYLEGKILDHALLSQFLTSGTVHGNPTYYGLGWQVSQDKMGRPYYGHIGNGVGGYSNFFVYPEQQMVFVLLVNCTDPKVQEILDVVVDGLLRACENA